MSREFWLGHLTEIWGGIGSTWGIDIQGEIGKWLYPDRVHCGAVVNTGSGCIRIEYIVWL